MGQYALLAVIAALVLGGGILYNAQRSAQAADDEVTAYQDDRFSREAALVGLKRMERRLAANLDEWDDTENSDAAVRAAAFALFNSTNTPYGPGTFTVTFDDYEAGTGTVSDIAYVTAVGRFQGQRYVVKAVYEKGITDVGTPPSMRSAILSNQDMAFTGSSVVVDGTVHTNANLTTSGGSSPTVNGSGTYLDSASPTIRFSGGSAQGDSILVPDVVIPPTGSYVTPAGVVRARLSGSASTPLVIQPTNSYVMQTNTSANGNGGWTNTTVPPPPASSPPVGASGNAYVLVINGNLEIDGDVRLLGYSRIYVNGNLTIGGNGVIAPVNSPSFPTNGSTSATINTWISNNLPSGGQMGIYTTGSITLQGTPTVIASLYANGDVNYGGGGNRLVIGGITTQSQISLQGNTRVFYTDASTTIFDPGINRLVPEGVRLISFREWATR